MKLIRSLLPAKPFVIANSNLTSSNVTETEYSAWASGTTYALADRVQIVSPTSTVTVSIASPGVVTWTAHGLPDNTPVRITTTGGLPTGLTAGQIYFTSGGTVNAFKLSLKPDGAPINTSGSQSGTHTAVATRHDVYESLQASNLGNAPALSASWWVRVDSTNRWRMHDDSMGSQTANTDSITNVYAGTGIIDALALLNISAQSIQVTMTDSVEGVVFDQTFSGISDAGITDYYAWFFDPVVRITDMAITNLPPYVDAAIAVTLTDTGGTALCGECVLGKVLDVGGTQYGMRLGIQDYSVKQRNAFGIYTVLERAFNRTSDMNVWVENTAVDAVANVLSEFRAIPTVYIGSEDFGSSIVFGYYKNFFVAVEFVNQSILSIEIEGLV